MKQLDIDLAVSPDTRALINELKTIMGVDTDAELFKQALALAREALRIRRRNGVVTLQGEGSLDINLIKGKPYNVYIRETVVYTVPVFAPNAQTAMTWGQDDFVERDDLRTLPMTVVSRIVERAENV